jgi:3-oxoacyl-[acyl-carrier protein] reductase
MDLGIDNKSYVVCGASRGLGRAVAEQLAVEGARVLVVGRDSDSLQEVAQELGEQAYSCMADLSEPSDIDEVVNAAAQLGGLDGVLVNAGGHPSAPHSS